MKTERVAIAVVSVALLVTSCTSTHSLLSAARRNNTEGLQAAISEGANLNRRDGGGMTALTYMANFGNTNGTVLLLDAGADVNLPNAQGLTPLDWAVVGCRPSMVKLLVERGGALKSPDVGCRALIHACAREPKHWIGEPKCQVEIVKLLLSGGVDPNCTAGGRKTALQFASDNGYSEIVKLLKDAGTKE